MKNNMKKLLWIDDFRNPVKYVIGDYDIVWVKNYDDFCKYINENGLPDIICFDHDLGDINNPNGEKTGYDCAKYLVDFCLDNDIKLPNFHSQSDNGPGRENILNLLENYKKFESKT